MCQDIQKGYARFLHKYAGDAGEQCQNVKSKIIGDLR